MDDGPRVAFKDLLTRQPPLLPWGWVAVLALFFLLPGTGQHDPWKNEDAIHLAIAHHIFAANPWAPAVAGEPWLHTPPLYHWLAAAFGHAASSFLPFHAAARLATTFFAGLALFAIARAAKLLYGETAGRIAPLLAFGTLGLIEWLHEAQPAIAGLAFAAVAWWGAALALAGQRYGSLLIGVGGALAFAAHGLAGLAMAGTAVFAPLTKRDVGAQALAAATLVFGIAGWLWLADRHAPAWWAGWWANEWAEATRARQWPSMRHVEQLLWLSWPLLPLAIAVFWRGPRRAAPAVVLPLAGAVLALLWYGTGSPRSLSFLPALLPLLLLAAAGGERLRRGAANAFDAFSLATFTFIAGLIWLGAAAQGFGWPERIARNFEKLAPGHVADYDLPAIAFAGALTCAWFLSWRLPRAPWRPVVRWSAGMTLMWGLIAALWLPWIDHYKSYRPVAMALAQALPASSGCIGREGLGPAHRAILDYFAGIRTIPAAKAAACDWRIVLASPGWEAPAGWRIVWTGGRPSDRKERWFLLERLSAGPSEHLKS